MTRDSNLEDSTDPDLLDIVIEDDGLSPDHRAEPTIVPDHGAQPRRLRPSEKAYNDDRENKYRPDNHHLVRSLHDDETLREDRRTMQQRLVARALAKTARFHAPKLARYRDDAIAGLIDREILGDVRVIASLLPAAFQAAAVDKFLQVLREEIALHRSASRKRDRRANNLN